MRNVAGTALTISAAFMALVAMLLDSPALFYMGTALIVLMAAARFQAKLAVRGLRFERLALTGFLARIDSGKRVSPV